jgi:hypothetical protein
MFTRRLLVPALLVVAIGGGLATDGAAVAGPSDVLKACVQANEFAAIASLRNICSGQAQFQACAAADEDNDGTGEYGCFAELSAARPVRGTKNLLNPPVLSGAYKIASKTGTVKRSGYLFAIYLPGKKGVPVPEGPGGGIPGGVLDADLAECVWLAYAWPVKHGETGRRTFVVNQYGDVYRTMDVYSGDERPPATAAFAAPKSKLDLITGLVGPEKKAADGLTWVAPPGVRRVVPFEAGVRASESAARTTLKVLSSAAAQFWAASLVDEDGDGKGEFGTFSEMSGALPLRRNKVKANPPLLSAPFKTQADDGTFLRDGYRYALWLPGPGGVGVRETKHGLAAGRTDPNLAEQYWVCYAWPEEFDKTGRYTYVITQASEIFRVSDKRYSGDAAPKAGAAFQPVETAPDITGMIATDRKTWKHVN